MKIEKAGCILVNKKNKTVGLVHREKQKDYSFPKGHRENNESLIECAIRETEEETKRCCTLVSTEPIAKEHYFDSKKDEVEMYYFLAIDNGKSNNDSLDTHKLIWVSYDKVEEILTYESLKKVWNEVKDIIKNIISNKK